MGRTFHIILRVLVLALLVSAGGIAPTQTLSAYLTYDDVTGDDSPLEAPYKDRLEDAYSVANRHTASAVRQGRAAVASQCCMRPDTLSRVYHLPVRYPTVKFSFARLFPDILSPPPRFAAVI